MVGKTSFSFAELAFFSYLCHPLGSRQNVMPTVDSKSMIGRVTRNVARILLAFSISLWLAGAGCMWGCSNMAMAAESRSTSAPGQHTVVVANSCHAKTHDCCARTSRQQTLN